MEGPAQGEGPVSGTAPRIRAGEARTSSPAERPPGAAIACLGIGKTLQHRTILADICLQVSPGEICALVGENGAGKTSLLKILGTLLTPSSGMAWIQGLDVVKSPRRARAAIGYIGSDERSFYARLSGRENLRFFGALHGMGPRAIDKGASRLLGVLGMDGLLARPFEEFSSGMKQALTIVRGLLHDPPVLLADEPTRSLGKEASERVWALILQEAARGKAVLFASHDAAEVARIADRAIRLSGGRTVP